MKLTDHQRRCIALATLLVLMAAGAGSRAGENQDTLAGPEQPTQTPIKHLVVIFQENVSFDHYFATYPRALNPAGSPRFDARPGTPAI